MLKRAISFVLVLCLMVVAVPFSVGAETSGSIGTIFDTESSLDNITVYSEQFIAGDVNNDGAVNSRDTLSLKRVVVGRSVSACRFTVDISVDGKINGKDTLTLKKLLSQIAAATVPEITTVEKQYDNDETAAKLSVTGVGENEALFDYSVQNIDLNEEKYIVIVGSGVDAVEVSAVSNEGSAYACGSAEVVNGEVYNGFIVELGALSELNASAVEVKYDEAPSVDSSVFVDSVLFASTEEEARALVQERLALRIPEPEAKYIRVDFNNADSTKLITATNHTNYYYDAGYDALRLQVAGGSGDPWALVDVSSYNISADEYKYVVLTTQTPSTMNQPTPEGELFFSAGSIAGPTAGYSSIYSVSKDSQFHSKIFEMTNATFWTGNVHSVRVDYFCACAVGDTQFIDSIVFCNTYEAAQAVCVNRETLTTDVKELFDYGLYHDGNIRIPYRIYVPYNYDSTQEYPVLTLLHGAGERGTNGTHQLTQGFPYLFDTTTNVAFNSIVIAPHCPEEYRWVEFYWGDANYSCNDVPESEPLKAVVKVLQNLPNNYSVDEDRYYVSGMSMGGFGTWDLLSRHSDMFAAAVPICGGGDTSKADVLKEIPIRTFHGTSDNIVPTRGTKNMYDAIIAAGGTKITYTPLGGMDHFIWDYVYQLDWVFDWLYQQNRADR